MKKSIQKENLKSIGEGYLITATIICSTALLQILIYFIDKFVKFLTKNTFGLINDWSILAITIISGFFALLTLFTTLLFQLIELIKKILKQNEKK